MPRGARRLAGGPAATAVGERARTAQVGHDRLAAARSERQAVRRALQERVGPHHQASSVVRRGGPCHLQGAEAPGQTVDGDRKASSRQVNSRPPCSRAPRGRPSTVVDNARVNNNFPCK